LRALFYLAVLGFLVALPNCGGKAFQVVVDASDEGGTGDDGALADSTGNRESGTPDSGGTADGGSGGDADLGCGASCNTTYRRCCNGQCVNPTNDPNNCGGCGNKCSHDEYCLGVCRAIPCANPSGGCSGGEICCGTGCCTPGQICCETEGPVATTFPTCVTPTGSPPTCPVGCAPLCVSDRSLKRGVAPVDARAVLEGVVSMPVATWSYKTDDPQVRHLGPMAQDFRATFGLGDTDRAYDPIDAHGVAFAAIQALYEQMRAQSARIERLERDNEELSSRCDAGR
jgi:Chaperone of endosialidase/Stigma-specific protein, Stig1